MNVKQLIEELNKFDPELEIIISSDPEGNSYTSFSGPLTTETFCTDDNYNYDRCDDADEYLVIYPG